MNDNMHISRVGIDLIREFEGYHTRLDDGRCQAYLDKLAKPPVWTIGYGVTEGVREGMVQTLEENLKAKAIELVKHENVVKRLVKVPLNQYQFDSTVSLSYNVGLERCKTFLKRLNAGDYQGAADAMLMYKFAGGVEYRGLLRRRKAERALFLRPVPVAKDVVESSSKLTFLRRARLFLGSMIPGGGFLEWLGYLEPVKSFAQENWHFILLGMIALTYFVFKWIEFKQVQDVKEDRYIPSGQETPILVEPEINEMTKADGEPEDA